MRLRSREAVLWVAMPLAGVAWTALRYRRSWYYFDAWVRLAADGGAWHDLVESHNGQLLVGTNLAYRLQVDWLGLDGHAVVYGAFCLSLLALHLSLAFLLLRLGLSSLLALVGGGALVYLGAAGEAAFNEFNLSHNLGLAIGLLAAAVVVAEEGTTRNGLVVAGLLLAALPFSSSLAAVTLVYVFVLVLGRWPRRTWAVALVPPTVLIGLWTLLADDHTAGTVRVTLDAGDRLLFVREVVISSFAALAGIRRDSSSVVSQREAALAVAAVLVLVIGAGVAAKRLDRLRAVNLVAGVAAASSLVAVLGFLRADQSFLFSGADQSQESIVFGGELSEVSLGANLLYVAPRYVQWVAIFLVLGCAPAIALSLQARAPASRRLVRFAAAAVVVAVFVVGLGPFRSDERLLATLSSATRPVVAQAVTVVEDGCPPPSRLEPMANVAETDLLKVAGLEALVERGAFPDGFGQPPDPALVRRLCAG